MLLLLLRRSCCCDGAAAATELLLRRSCCCDGAALATELRSTSSVALILRVARLSRRMMPVIFISQTFATTSLLDKMDAASSLWRPARRPLLPILVGRVRHRTKPRFRLELQLIRCVRPANRAHAPLCHHHASIYGRLALRQWRLRQGQNDTCHVFLAVSDILSAIAPAVLFKRSRLRARALEKLGGGISRSECAGDAPPHRGGHHRRRSALDPLNLLAEAQQRNFLDSGWPLERKISEPKQTSHPKIGLVGVK